MSRLPEEYPEAPGFKTPGASEDAAAAVAPTAALLRKQVLDVIRLHPTGLTADEISEKLNRSVLSIRPRVSELNRGGEIQNTGVRRKNESGMTATVWRAAPAPMWTTP